MAMMTTEQIITELRTKLERDVWDRETLVERSGILVAPERLLGKIAGLKQALDYLRDYEGDGDDGEAEVNVEASVLLVCHMGHCYPWPADLTPHPACMTCGREMRDTGLRVVPVGSLTSG